ncbi:glycosyltransferase family 4 protein [Flavobacterium sp. FlaQc-48]|uniref:glycosyltransferase family 4 protein n=1 Tax=Flavobacterium sp. FlaQc-48 TaxID=3374181 RepID=UPI0037576258
MIKKIRSLLAMPIALLDRKYFFKGFRKKDLLIYDDIFPHPVSGFRSEEFTVLLNNFSKSKIIVEPLAYPIVNTPIEDHIKHIEQFEAQNNSLKKKLKLKKRFININTKLFYCVFLNNIYMNLEWIERYKIPFIFTLYPGGGFQLNESISDSKLKRVLESQMFRKVIVTQKITQDYLLEKKLCSHGNIEFIFGGVVPQISLNKDLGDKKTYLKGKTTFDICFCAAKYTPKGEDKGYDVFIDFAIEISRKYDFVRFHIIGGFTDADIDVRMLEDKIKFYGYQNFESLGRIYKNMDVLISPNKAFILGKGAFDGFPLGTVVEAVLNGVVVLITDELKQNNSFIANVDLILIESQKQSLINQIENLIQNPEKLYSISENGRKKFQKVYSNEIQMLPRIAILQNEIAKT